MKSRWLTRKFSIRGRKIAGTKSAVENVKRGGKFGRRLVGAIGNRKEKGRKGWKEGGRATTQQEGEWGARFLRNSHGKLTGGWVWALCALWGCLGVAARCLQKQRTAAVTRPATLRIRKTSAITNQIVCIPRIVDASESVKETRELNYFRRKREKEGWYFTVDDKEFFSEFQFFKMLS